MADDLDDSFSHNSSFSGQDATCMSQTSSDFIEFDFSSKGLHICNLNVRHILPKIDDIRIVLSSKQGSDIVGMCEIS